VIEAWDAPVEVGESPEIKQKQSVVYVNKWLVKLEESLSRS
jgi:hypothetical protein